MSSIHPSMIVYSGGQGTANLLRGLFNYGKSLDTDNNNLLSASELQKMPVLASHLNNAEFDSFTKSIAPLDGEAGVSAHDLAVALLHAETAVKVEGNPLNPKITPVGQMDGVITQDELLNAAQEIKQTLQRQTPFSPGEQLSTFHTVPGLTLSQPEQHLQNTYERVASVISPNPFQAYQSWKQQPAEQFNRQYQDWLMEVAYTIPENQSHQLQEEYARLGLPQGIDYGRLITDEAYAEQVMNQINTSVEQTISGPLREPSLDESARKISQGILNADSSTDSISSAYLAIEQDPTGHLMAQILHSGFIRQLDDNQLQVWAHIVGQVGTHSASARDSHGYENGLGAFILRNIESSDPKLSRAARNGAAALKHYWKINDDLSTGAYESDPSYAKEARAIRKLLTEIRFPEIQKKYQ